MSKRLFRSNKVPVKSDFDKFFTLTDTVLGKGAYAEVRLGKKKGTEEKVAVKIIDKQGMSKKDLAKLNKEVTILKSLNHKNVVRVFDNYEERDTFFIVMEYVTGGELFTKIVNEDAELFTEEKSRQIVRTIAEALKYCKDQGVIHRDIKPENILLTSEEDGGQIKLADFNLSKKLEKEQVNFSVLETMCGTPNYVAPEVISGKPYDYKCDIWSLGVITYLLLSGGYLPFYIDPEKEGRDALLRKVRGGKWSFTPAAAWSGVSDEGKDLLSKMMRKDPEGRLTYEQVLGHPWFKADDSMLQEKINLTPLIELNKKRKMLAAANVKNAANALGELMGSPEDTSTQQRLRGQLSGFDGFNVSLSGLGGP